MVPGQPEEVLPEDAWALIQAGAVVIDIRDEQERQTGMVLGATGIAPGQLSDHLKTHSQTSDQPLFLCCASGKRSLERTRQLRNEGYQQVVSIAGGFNAWMKANLPAAVSAAIPDGWTDRYARHLVLKGVGLEGQQRLTDSSVLLVGAGGLGCPAALYLAAAGIGTLGIVDDDRVERSNLQRQVLHSDADVGMLKVQSAESSLLALNPDIQVKTYSDRLAGGNHEQLLSGWDIVIDGSDNRETRYLVNAFCMKNSIPLVYGAVSGFDGQVSLFHRGHSGCYECMFPRSESNREFADCQQSGVLGVLPGLVGTLQAAEAIKWVLGIGEPLTGRLLLLDGLGTRFQSIALQTDPKCPACSSGPQSS